MVRTGHAVTVEMKGSSHDDAGVSMGRKSLGCLMGWRSLQKDMEYKRKLALG